MAEAKQQNEQNSMEAENERLKKRVKVAEAEALKAEEEAYTAEEALEKMTAENERLKEELKKMTADWVDRCEVLERVEERADWAEEECNILEGQIKERDEELEALRSTPDGTPKAELEEKDELIKELEEQLEALKAVKPAKKKRAGKRGALKYPENSKWVKKLNEEQEALMREIYDDTEETFTLKWDEENTKRNGSESYDIYESFKNETALSKLWLLSQR